MPRPFFLPLQSTTNAKFTNAVASILLTSYRSKSNNIAPAAKKRNPLPHFILPLPAAAGDDADRMEM